MPTWQLITSYPMKLPFVFLAFIWLFNLSYAQGKKSFSDATSKPSATAPLIVEKVYLHFDRPYYASGEDIWFKAYLTEAFTNKLTDNSNCLYVEFISPDSRILQRHVIRMKDGKGNGDFHLDNSLASGKYQVRAYTNCMRNFGNYFFFKKEIQVENISGLNGAAVQPDSLGDKLDIQFFPEGGSLVENVYSVIGFKAMNSSGTGCNAQGAVITSAGDTIAQFISTHLGMGNFNFIPKSGMIYFAVGKTDQGATFKAELPAFLKTGYVIKISEYDTGTLRLTIKTNQATLANNPEQKLLLIGISRGKLCITIEVKVKNLITNVRIPRNQFPEGISRLTLLDDKYKPLCERLVYFQRNQNISVGIKTDKKLYAPHDKVTMQIAVKDTNNNPVAVNMSIAVIDASEVKTIEEHASDICSYFLLESEIHGKIEQPAYYFDASEADRHKALDLLLLTQGWRDFVWKHLADSTIKHEYDIEKGISVSGKLQRLLTNRPIANANISLGLFGGNEHYLNLTKTDTAGRYNFDGLDFTGERTLIVSATNKNNRSQGFITTDSLFGLPPLIDYKWIAKSEKLHKEITDFKSEAESRY